VSVQNQFGTDSVRIRQAEMLCVPTAKFEGTTTTTTTVVPATSTTTTTLCTTPPCTGRAVTPTGGGKLCLSQILQGGCVAHPESGCASYHLHGLVQVQGQSQPIPDPNPTGCGHGPVGVDSSCQGQTDTVPPC
jgi:hypothetical protein